MAGNNMEGLKNLPKNLEGLKQLGQKYQEESVEERKKRRCQLAFPAVINLIMGIVMVALGAANHNACVGNKATLFLMVGGSILLSASTLKLTTNFVLEALAGGGRSNQPTIQSIHLSTKYNQSTK